MRKRQGRLLRKYALVFGALVGGTLIAGSLVQLYFSYQQSQAAVLQILADDDRPSEVHASRVDPHLIGDGRIIRWH